jgi:hypothetical protein
MGIRNKSDLCVLCVMCLGGVRFTYVFMCYVLEHITHKHITHSSKILYIKIQFLLVLLLHFETLLNINIK